MKLSKYKHAFETDFPLTFINNKGFINVNFKGTKPGFGSRFLSLSVSVEIEVEVEDIVCAFSNLDDN